MTNYSRNSVENPAAANSDLRHLVRATSQLQEQVRSAVQRLEQSTSSSGELAQGPEHQGLEWYDGSTMMRAPDMRLQALCSFINRILASVSSPCGY